MELHPNYWLAHFFWGLTYEQQGDLARALAELEKSKSLGDSPWRLGGLGHAYALAGMRAEAEQVLAELRALAAERYVSPYHSALVYAGLGENDRAVEWLEKAFQDRSWLVTCLGVDPLLDGLRSDSRFQELLRRLGLPP